MTSTQQLFPAVLFMTNNFSTYFDRKDRHHFLNEQIYLMNVTRFSLISFATILDKMLN